MLNYVVNVQSLHKDRARLFIRLLCILKDEDGVFKFKLVIIELLVK